MRYQLNTKQFTATTYPTSRSFLRYQLVEHQTIYSDNVWYKQVLLAVSAGTPNNLQRQHMVQAGPTCGISWNTEQFTATTYGTSRSYLRYQLEHQTIYRDNVPYKQVLPAVSDNTAGTPNNLHRQCTIQAGPTRGTSWNTKQFIHPTPRQQGAAQWLSVRCHIYLLCSSSTHWYICTRRFNLTAGTATPYSGSVNGSPTCRIPLRCTSFPLFSSITTDVC